MSVKLEVVNGKVVRQGLESLAKAYPDVGRQRLYNAARAIFARYNYSKTQPPPRGRYIRTFTLEASRLITKTEMGYIFTMDAVSPKGKPYSVYVVGSMEFPQAWMHAGRWPPLQKVVNEEVGKMPSGVLRDLAVVLEQETRKASSGIG